MLDFPPLCPYLAGPGNMISASAGYDYRVCFDDKGRYHQVADWDRRAQAM